MVAFAQFLYRQFQGLVDGVQRGLVGFTVRDVSDVALDHPVIALFVGVADELDFFLFPGFGFKGKVFVSNVSLRL